MSDTERILTLTACPTGIAHTFMAAENLEQSAHSLSHKIKVETHGSIGVGNALTAEDIERSDAVVVAEAKRQMFGEVGIDLFAGLADVLIVADEHADPLLVAVDLLSQAEYGPGSPAVLITTSEALGRKVLEHVEELLVDMPTSDFAEPAWQGWGAVYDVHAYALADAYAYDHVQIVSQKPREDLENMHDYRALFLGKGTCVFYGDKVMGTNHVLPTPGGRQLHRWPVGGQVSAHCHIPGSDEPGLQRLLRRAVRPGGAPPLPPSPRDNRLPERNPP